MQTDILLLLFQTSRQNNNYGESHILPYLSDRGNNKTVISQDTSELLFPSVGSPLLLNCCQTINDDWSEVMRLSICNIHHRTEAVKN